MLWVAVLLLPMLSALLAVMDRVETRLLAPAPAHRRHASPRRRLRLIRGGASDAPATVVPAAVAPAPGAASPGVPAPDTRAGDARSEVPSTSEVPAAGRVLPSEARAA
ncbi:hypothetical protein [Streptomyces sp. NPDC020597]|uniref:hypothetical protein n=1 Tax=unclassified Streptomyces TaxID=2593676 RepID=UPI003797C992